MTTLFVGRIDAHAVAEDVEGGRLMADRLTGVLARTAHALDGELPTIDDRALVCVRRLDVVLALDDGTTDDTASAWARTIGSTIAGVVGGTERQDLGGAGPRSSGAEVVEFPDEAAALADLVAALAVGDRSRAWAWTLAGLTDPGGPQDGDLVSLDARRIATLRALMQRPEDAAAAVVAAARTTGLPAVHRLLGPGGWLALAGRLLEVAGSGIDVAALAEGVSSPSPTDPQGTTSAVVVTAFAQVAARCGLVVPAPTALGWAVVALGDARPDLLTEAVTPALLVALAAELASAATPVGAGPAPTTRSTSRWHGLEPSSVGEAAAEEPAPNARAMARADEHEAEADERDAGLATSNAGLLFLLTVAAEAGLPGLALEDTRLSEREPTWVLAHLALRLSVADVEDPAVRVFSGLDTQAPVELLDPATADEEAALDEASATWAAATARRMYGEDERRGGDTDLVRRVVSREGRVLAAPGWVEVVLAAADVDIDVRRAGLDLDPGFVPWLGAVVRFRYE